MASAAPASPRGSYVGAGVTLARRAFRDARVRTISFASVFAIYAYVQPIGYRHAYPTAADRLGFAHGFGQNKALRLFYGEPRDLLSVNGYVAWRVGGTLAIAAAAFGLLAAVRALRAEEDAGRTELVLAGGAGRGQALLASLVAIAAGTAVLWVAELAGFLLGGMPVPGSAYLALAGVSVVPVCVGIGALASQIAPSRRSALELGGGVVALAFLLRVIADTSAGAGWLRWATPLGWAEEMRPFGGARPLVLLLPLTASALLLAAAARIGRSRDIGAGLLAPRDSASADLRLLSSPMALALRGERGSLLVWLGGIGGFAFILGMVATSISSAGISQSVQRVIAKFGSGSIETPSGYLGFVFIFFIFAVSMFVCAQVSAARHEEAEERLDTLLAEPVGRRGWLAGRLLLAVGACAALAVSAGLLAWAGAASQGVSISLPRMLEAGANCLPVAILFLGVAALGYALVPRASVAVAYGLVSVAFLWQLVGSLLGVPSWLVELTPFAHVGFVPAQPFRPGSAAVMVGIGLLAALGSLWAFACRDLVGQ